MKNAAKSKLAIHVGSQEKQKNKSIFWILHFFQIMPILLILFLFYPLPGFLVEMTQIFAVFNHNFIWWKNQHHHKICFFL